VPEILPGSDPRFIEVQEYLERISKEADLNGSFDREKGELLIKTWKNKLR